MGFFDSISQALGTDGGGGGLNLAGFTDQVSNALGTDGSKNGLLNDPISLAAAAAVAAYATGGLSLLGGAATEATAGTALSGTALTGAASDAAFNAALAGAGGSAGGFSLAGIGSGLLSAVDLAAKVAGGYGAITSFTNKPRAALPSGGAGQYGNLVPFRSGVGTTGPLDGETQGAQNQAPNSAGGTGNAAPIVIAPSAEKPKDSTLTMLASALTIGAIVYQFSKGKK